jgi:putative membrane protein
MYLYLKAIHIIFMVTWFAGMFYIVRLFIYSAEAREKPEAAAKILLDQFSVMKKRLWFGITWPSALITLLLGPWLWFLMGGFPKWLMAKLIFVIGLYAYHLSLHRIYQQQKKGRFLYSGQQLRIWNEVATLFLFAIVFIAVVKDAMGWAKGLLGLLTLGLLLFLAIKLYKRIRNRRPSRNR